MTAFIAMAGAVACFDEGHPYRGFICLALALAAMVYDHYSKDDVDERKADED